MAISVCTACSPSPDARRGDSRRSGSGGLTSVHGKSPGGRQGVRLDRCVVGAHRCGAAMGSSANLDGPRRQRPGSHVGSPRHTSCRCGVRVVGPGAVLDGQRGLQGARGSIEVASKHRLPTGDDEAVSRGRSHEPMIGPGIRRGRDSNGSVIKSNAGVGCARVHSGRNRALDPAPGRLHDPHRPGASQRRWLPTHTSIAFERSHEGIDDLTPIQAEHVHAWGQGGPEGRREASASAPLARVP